MNIIFSPFDKLSPQQLEDLFRLRQQVFIIEQQCFYEDIDGEDDKAEHLLIYKEDQLAAYMRIFQAGAKYKQQSNMGRIVVHPDFRGTDIGPSLINKGIEFCENTPIRIEAQAALIGYYNQFGFKEEGETYVVDNIDHIQMVLSV
ncbi:MAG: GNAT family N-acetyltransferase [Balneolaceae bacterium]|nr:GNAT family N-acetyltransferase [Balneolaceae bacterium]